MASKFIKWTNKELLEELNNPVIITAFEGWNDAGEAATTALKYFQDRFSAIKIGAIESEEFFDFTISRPVIEIPDEQRKIIWPATEILIAKMFDSKHDLVIIVGHEPQLRWRTFTEQVIEVASLIESHMVVTLGSLLTDIPHSRPVKVFGSSDDSELARRMNTEAMKAVKYGGLSEEEALNFVTINPAKQLKIDKWVGSLEEGKDADFVIWDGHPL